MNKKAVLIMTHKNKEQVIRLIRKFDDPRYEVFVHMDERWSISQDELRQDMTNVHFTKNRYKGTLLTWSLVEITLELLKTAKDYEEKTGDKYNHYLLLSGQDYLLKNIDYIYDYLEENYPRSFIDCTPYSPKNWMSKKFGRYNLDKLHHFLYIYMKNVWIRRCFTVPVLIMEKIIVLFKGTPYKNLTNLDVELYGGSEWWILTDKIVDYILMRIQSDPVLIKTYKQSYGPDETFFQTMAMNSPMKETIEVNAIDARDQNCMTFAYFTDSYDNPDAKKPFQNHPYIIKEEDFEWIKEFPHFFARKFDMKEDKKILDMLDSYTGK